MRGRQKRFQKHENHCIFKRIISLMERSQLGIALENLKGIQARVKASRAIVTQPILLCSRISVLLVQWKAICFSWWDSYRR